MCLCCLMHITGFARAAGENICLHLKFSLQKAVALWWTWLLSSVIFLKGHWRLELISGNLLKDFKARQIMIVWTDRLPLPTSLYCLFAVDSLFAKLMAKEKGARCNSLFSLPILCALGSAWRYKAENACWQAVWPQNCGLTCPGF